jgi:hypothetical protein
MLFLIINKYIHNKNLEGLIMILNNLKINYKFGDINDIKDADIIYSPSEIIDVKKYKNKKFIFGPHFSVFPDNNLEILNFKDKNHKYIQPSLWVKNLWIDNFNTNINIDYFPFPVNVNKFKEIKKDKNKVILYYKSRDPKELFLLENFLNIKNIEYKIFNYSSGYNEIDFLNYLQDCKYGIVLGRHESQGFAIEEMLSCNVPLLVWDVKYMSQEYGQNYNNYYGTSIPYWDKRCGEYFFDIEELENKYNYFISNIDNYKPREYILENLSVEKCSERFKEIFLN